jgi:Fe-Mn family superoxide dismutase
MHSVPALSNHVELEKNGIPGLLSAKGFDIAYTQYHAHILDELNAVTQGAYHPPTRALPSKWLTPSPGTKDENQDPKSLILSYARDPMWAYGFNHASMAFNNHFFFKGLASDPNATSTPPTELLPKINNSFSSLETLKETFLATADAMFGPGFVWLVQKNDTADRKLMIMTTYLAGSPLPGAHHRRQQHDLNNHNADSYRGLNAAGSFGAASKVDQTPTKALGGVDVVPLLCVNTWEHVWLHDYGVRGKAAYLEAWWNKINWNQVRDLASLEDQSRPAGGMRRFAYA